METSISPRITVRERLAAGEPADLSEEELLALILSTGTAGADALLLARHLLAHFGDLRGLSRASLAQLCAHSGIGAAKATRIQASLELGRRSACRALPAGDTIRTSRQVAQAYVPRMAHLDREHFVALLLDSKHRKIKDVCVSVGSLDATIVHPREVFRPAISESAAAVILIHNHPSGDPSPSPEDLQVTRRLMATAEVLGVELLDHLIVGKGGAVSLREMGEMGRRTGL